MNTTTQNSKSFSPKSLSPNTLSISDNEILNESESNSISSSISPITVQSKFNDMFYNTYYYQLRGNKLLCYSYSEFRSSHQKEQIEILNEKKNETYRGEMTEKVVVRLRKKMNIWYEAIQYHNKLNDISLIKSQRKMVFVTLTLSANQIHSDQEIKLKVLKPFLRILRDKYNVKNYIWKAESQENGRIHFHLVIDRYINKHDISRIWNKCQNALGYIDEFFKKFKHNNPPSTDIHAVRDKAGMIQYLEKYISKSDKYRKINGACWKGSQSVMTLQFFEFVGDSQIESAIIKGQEKEQIRVVKMDRYRMFISTTKDFNSILPNYVLVQHYNYLDLRDQFLFVSDIVFNFRDFCYLFASEYFEQPRTLPFICTKEYPLPVQLNIWEVSEFHNLKKYMQ